MMQFLREMLRYLLIGLIGILLFILIFLVVYNVAAAPSARYQMIRVNDNRGWFWIWSDSLPYTSLGGMCWDDVANNFCEANFNMTQINLLRVIIDTSPDAPYHYGSLYQENKRNGRCFVWWWFDDYGADLNPHMATVEWAVCP